MLDQGLQHVEGARAQRCGLAVDQQRALTEPNLDMTKAVTLRQGPLPLQLPVHH